MNKLQKLLSAHGSTMAEDAGVRPEGHGQPVSPSPLDGRTRLSNAVRLEVSRIKANPQIRTHFDQAELANLAASLKDHGQEQSIEVRWSQDDGMYVLIDGERRWRAAQLASITHLDAIVVEAKDEAEVVKKQLITFLFKSQLRPVEQARAFKRAMELHNITKGKDLAAFLHIDPSTVSRSLAYLDLPPEVQEQIDSGKRNGRDSVKAHKAGTTTARKPVPRGGTKRMVMKGTITVTMTSRKSITAEAAIAALDQAAADLRKELAAPVPAAA